MYNWVFFAFCISHIFECSALGDPRRERRPVGGDEAQTYCRRQPECHTEAQGFE